MAIYTRAGDNGKSSTITRTSLSKDSPIFDTLGNIDELKSNLNLAKSKANGEIKKLIEDTENSLSLLSSELAGGKKFATRQETEKLEKAIDSLSPVIPENILEAKHISELGALLDLSRTVARRAERSAVAASTKGGITKELTAYLNRLSDYLYALSFLADLSHGGADNTESPLTVGSVDNFCEKAVALSKKVREYAKSMGVKVVVAVCDAGANLVSVQRDDDAYIASIDIAINKAFTSASLKMSTKRVGELAKPDAPLYGIQFTNNGKIVIFGGGEPIIKNGVIIGALGVSGGSLSEDTEIARYASELFKKEM